MQKTLSILIVGVGGQGTLVASRVLGTFAMQEGYDCKLSEVHGMSQRGGSVVTHVRMGDKVYSPVIEEGTADYILAFEKLEAYRYRSYLKEGGTAFVNDQEILPMPVITGQTEYPSDCLEKMRAECKNVVTVDALSLANEAGDSRAVNTVLIACLLKALGVDYGKAEKALAATVKEKILALNVKALKLGYSL